MGAKPDENKAEIKDAKLIFDLVWREAVERHGKYCGTCNYHITMHLLVAVDRSAN